MSDEPMSDGARAYLMGMKVGYAAGAAAMRERAAREMDIRTAISDDRLSRRLHRNAAAAIRALSLTEVEPEPRAVVGLDPGTDENAYCMTRLDQNHWCGSVLPCATHPTPNTEEE